MKKIVSVIFACLTGFVSLLTGGTAWAANVSNVEELYLAIAARPPEEINIIQSITLESGAGISCDINISADVTIRAGAGVVISGDAKWPIFNISDGATATFDSVTFQNAKGADSKGAIHVADGGAIFRNSTFKDNTDGPAVTVAAGGRANFTGGEFQGNTAGAIKNAGTIYVSGVTFDNNSSKPAVTVDANANAGFNSITRFLNNTAGAVEIDGSREVSFDSTTVFTGNKAASGGAVNIKSGNAAFIGGTFSSNEATGNGGAVSITDGNVSFDGGSFTFNEAGGNGGALYLKVQPTFSGMLNFGSNSAENGGAIAVETGTKTSLNGSLSFRDNKAAQNGGAVHATGEVEVSGGDFYTNTAAGSGGAIYGGGAVSIAGGTFSGNKSTAGAGNAGGGAVYAIGNIKAGSEGTSITLDGNEATLSGGALFSEADIDATDAVFKNNTAKTKDGGAIYSAGKSTVTNSFFGVDDKTGNSAGGSGGAIRCENLKIGKSTFLSNIAQNGGAIMFMAKTDNEISNSLFGHNLSTTRGGAIVSDNGASETTITDSVFDTNSTTGQAGGALSFVNGKTLLLNRCTFEGNTVDNPSPLSQGGAADINVGTFQAVNCTFYGNTAGDGKGGALYLGTSVNNDGVESKSVLLYCTFVSNQSRLGGALYSNADNINIAASIFLGNLGTTGGDVFRESGELYAESDRNKHNFIGAYGMGTTPGSSSWSYTGGIRGGHDYDKTDRTAKEVFGGNVLDSNGCTTPVGAELTGLQRTADLKTVALTEASPAMDVIPGDPAINLYRKYIQTGNVVDERSKDRPNSGSGLADIGAYEGGSDSPPGPEPGGTIREIKMSGIPNTMVRVGQTCRLTALAYYMGETTPPSASEPVTWSSSKPYVASIDPYGGLISLTPGTTVITVTANRPSSGGQYKSDARTLTVQDWGSADDDNIHPDVWRKLGGFNLQVQPYAEEITFPADFDSSVIKAASFSGAFKSAYGIAPEPVTEIPDAGMIDFASASNLKSGAALKPSLSVTLTGASPASGGGVLPLRVTYSLSWDEVSDLLGSPVTQTGIDKLFGSLSLAFTDRYGNQSILVDKGGKGIGASGSVLTLVNGGNGVTLTFDILLSDADAAGDGKPRMIENKYLTVADGAADGVVGGSLWLIKNAESGGGGGGNSSEGGGGCDAGLGLLALSAGAAALLVPVPRRRNRG